ncbi:MAG: probable exported protein STY0357, partial [uncultured Microvirga sp.]
MVKRSLVLAGVLLGLTACQGEYASTKHLAPIPPATMALMSKKGLSKSDPILIRSYKKESELEVWKRGSDGQYAHLKTYPICRWSGQLGPKVREGDRQAPEGFYNINPAQMNPNSSFYLSFDTGYPNAYDRSHGRTGSHLMVHGSCSSRGCFAMTDEAIAEVFAIGREAFSGGQRNFQFQSYPFRMTAENLAKHRADPHIAFWKNLKEGSDLFEVAKDEPRVSVAGGRYVFEAPGGDPDVAGAVAEKRSSDERKIAELVEKGTPAIKLVYDDGGQHTSFRQTMVATAGGESDGNFPILNSRPGKNLGDVSRPEALAMGPREVVIDGPAAKPKPEKASTMLAQAATAKAAASKAAERPKGGREPEPKTSEPATTVAQAEPKPVSASPGIGNEAKSVYNRMFGGSGTPAADPSRAETAQAEPAAPSAAAAPRRPPP